MNNDNKQLTKKEVKALDEILEVFENNTLRDTGLKNINGAYATAKMFDYDDDTINIELYWGEQDMGNGSCVGHIEQYTIDRTILLSNMNLSDKVKEIQ